MIVGSLLLILVAAVLVVVGLIQASNVLLISAILLCAVAAVLIYRGSRQPAAVGTTAPRATVIAQSRVSDTSPAVLSGGEDLPDRYADRLRRADRLAAAETVAPDWFGGPGGSADSGSDSGAGFGSDSDSGFDSGSGSGFGSAAGSGLGESVPGGTLSDGASSGGASSDGAASSGAVSGGSVSRGSLFDGEQSGRAGGTLVPGHDFLGSGSNRSDGGPDLLDAGSDLGAGSEPGAPRGGSVRSLLSLGDPEVPAEPVSAPPPGHLGGSAFAGPAHPATVEADDEEPEYEDDPVDEPPAQDVAPAVAARIGRLTTRVWVVDGRPRYHLSGCHHLVGRDPEPLPVGEAQALGFSPCGLCEPATALGGRS
ncbi:hypothetical protein [Longispora sp. K20-0274]|uniref:hypothetical protein n=1 Tax=Longispora sp. K20-0274 TaxID=3088255 RepID=UPI00399B966E